MKVLGIIAEYNPLHNGHIYHIERSKSLVNPDYTVCIMSGNFTQRGEPALLSKWLRSEMAVKSGIDLVLELPALFACNNAEYFAYGALKILSGINCVTHLSFGCETSSIEPLQNLGKFLANESTEYKANLKTRLKEGVSFPKAREQAISQTLGDSYSSILNKPNNILGIEYLKQIALQNCSIQAVGIQRHGAGYNDSTLSGSLASASGIRLGLSESKSIAEYIPPYVYEILKSQCQNWGSLMKLRDEKFYTLLMSKIFSMTEREIKEIYSVSEGLENKLIKAAIISKNLAEFKANLISKRYTSTRINRILIHLYLNLTRDLLNHIPENNKYYGRILAFNQKGAELLKIIKKDENALPCITNINKERSKLGLMNTVLDFDIRAVNLYNLLTDADLYKESDYVKTPFMML